MESVHQAKGSGLAGGRGSTAGPCSRDTRPELQTERMETLRVLFFGEAGRLVKKPFESLT